MRLPAPIRRALSLCDHKLAQELEDTLDRLVLCEAENARLRHRLNDERTFW
jgi:hypothetical protein